MIIKGPTVGTPTPRTNYNQTDPAKADYLRGKDALDQKIEDAKKAGIDAANDANTAAANAKTVANDHIANTSNPHSVTKSQIGLGNVNNTSDANKPVSTAQATAIADAKKAGTDAQTAAANALSHSNTQVKKARPRNLLDNSDWRNPVNQRGATTYNAACHSIDRWLNTYTRPQWTINSGYVTLKNDSADYTYFATQKLLKGTLKSGVSYTAVAKIRNKTNPVFAVVVAPSSGNNAYGVFETGNFEFYLEKASDVDKFALFIPKSFSVSIEWVALYEGSYTADTLPEYQSKGYGNELRECMLYFQPIKGVGNDYFTPLGFGWGTSSTKVRCAIPLSAPMREGVVPSIEKNTFTNMYVFDGSERSVSEVSVVNATTRAPTNVIVVDVTTTITERRSCTFVAVGGELWISKDL